MCIMGGRNPPPRHYTFDVRRFLATVDILIHGTTLATNTLIAGRGARTGMIPTKGFRDILEIRRGIKPVDTSLYNVFIPPNRPLVPRSRRLGVEERVGGGGVVGGVNEAVGRVLGRGGGLELRQFSLLVKHEAVGKCSADIDCHALFRLFRFHRHLSPIAAEFARATPASVLRQSSAPASRAMSARRTHPPSYVHSRVSSPGDDRDFEQDY